MLASATRAQAPPVISWVRCRTILKSKYNEQSRLTAPICCFMAVKQIRKVKAARSRGKVYSMAFVGINGVGKSTSLAKVAYYLKENGIKVCVDASWRT